jgi:hypothetical protein
VICARRVLFGRTGFEHGEAVVLQAKGAPREPDSFGHPVNHGDFDVAHWSFGTNEAGEELVEFGLRFGWQNLEVASQAVTRGVVPDDLLTCLGRRAGAEFGIAAIRKKFSFRDTALLRLWLGRGR